MEFSWIQRHALLVLIRTPKARAVELCPPDVAPNLFAYHLERLVAGGYIEKVARGEYALTVKGEKLAGTFSTSTTQQTENIKTVIMLYAKTSAGYLVFRWSRQPYIGRVTPLYDRVAHGVSLEDAVASACRDKLRQVLPAQYKAAALIKILHNKTLISHMNAYVYEVDVSELPLPIEGRNGTAFISLNDPMLMDGVMEFFSAVETANGAFETHWTY